MAAGVAVVGHLRAASAETPVPVDYTAAVLTDHLPVSLNPLVDAEDPAVEALTPLLYRCLLKLDSSSYPVPDLASQLSIDPAGLTYTLELQPGLRWSDGSPITLEDALATIQWVQSSTFPDASLAAPWHSVQASVDAGSLVLSLTSPRASLATTLTDLPILPLGSMTPAEIAGLAGRASSPLPTSGPYQVAGQHNAVITLTANPHASASPRLGRVEVEAMSSFATAAQAFARGSLSAVLATTPAEQTQLTSVHGATARDALTFGFVDLLFNEQTPGLNDTAVRHAIAGAIDRRAIVSGPIGGLGTPQYGPFPAGLLWLQNQQPALPADPTAAAGDLADAGWVSSPYGARIKGGVSLTFTLSVPDAAPLPAVAQMVAAQLVNVGIAVSVSVVPSTTYLADVLEPGKFQLALASWDQGADPDLTDFWASTSVPPDGYNVSGGSADPFLDQDLALLATETGQAQREAAAAQVVAALNQDMPAVFLYAPEEGLVVNSRSLTNVVVPAAGSPFADAAVWRS